MVRDPRKLFASTVKLWLSLAEVQGMQPLEDNARLRAYIWDCLQRMYASFEAARAKVPAENLIDVHYEQLIEKPEETMANVYQRLQLGDYSKVGPMIAQRFANDREYKVNEHRIDPELEAAVLAHWGDYARKYGYA